MFAFTTPQIAGKGQTAETSAALIPLPFGATCPQHTNFYGPGCEIYTQGEAATQLYQVEFGAVRVYRLLSDGRRQISAFYMPGEVFGFEGDTIHHFFAEAIIGTNIRSFRASQLNDASHILLPMTLRGLTRAQEHLLVLGRQTAAERVAAFLLDLAHRQGELEQIDLPMSRMDIGDYLGLTIETVSRVFSRLKAKGIIALPSLRTAEILKWKTLEAMSD